MDKSAYVPPVTQLSVQPAETIHDGGPEASFSVGSLSAAFKCGPFHQHLAMTGRDGRGAKGGGDPAYGA